MTAPQEPLRGVPPAALGERLKRNADGLVAMGFGPRPMSYESRREIARLLSEAATFVDDAAELRAACEAAKSALTALDRVQMYGSADTVRDRAKRALDLIDAALAASEGRGEP